LAVHSPEGKSVNHAACRVLTPQAASLKKTRTQADVEKVQTKHQPRWWCFVCRKKSVNHTPRAHTASDARHKNPQSDVEESKTKRRSRSRWRCFTGKKSLNDSASPNRKQAPIKTPQWVACTITVVGKRHLRSLAQQRKNFWSAKCRVFRVLLKDDPSEEPRRRGI
jgi:transposase-like protein